MATRNKSFLIGLVCIIVLTIAATIIIKSLVPQVITPFWPLLVLFFTVVCIVVFFTTMKVKDRGDIRKFTNFYMVLTILKLVIYLAILLLYAILMPSDSKAFIITFLIYYLCFSIFETYILVKKTK